MKELALISNARQALMDAASVDEVKDISDKAVAAKLYLKRAGYGREMIVAASEVVIRGQRRCGELLAEMEKTRCKGHREKVQSVPTTALKLKDIGITKDQSSKWQVIATIPDDAFENKVAELRTKQSEMTTAFFVRLAREMHEEQNETESSADGETVVTGDLSELESKFGTVYADPPWQYGNQGTRAATGNHYSTMSVDEICEMPVESLVADDAHLHLWTTNAFLFDARRVMEAWGFEYKSCFVWVKPQMGIGNYWRVSHEFMLLGIRGNCPFRDRSQMSWREIERTKHSAKPASIRGIIEKVSPGPYLELFGREQVDGWTVFGNQISPQQKLW